MKDKSLIDSVYNSAYCSASIYSFNNIPSDAVYSYIVDSVYHPVSDFVTYTFENVVINCIKNKMKHER